MGVFITSLKFRRYLVPNHVGFLLVVVVLLFLLKKKRKRSGILTADPESRAKVANA